MTGNKAYLADYQEIHDGGFVAFGSNIGCVWRPRVNAIDQLSKDNKSICTHGHPHHALKSKGIVDSGYSKNMTGNKAYLADYQEIHDGGFVAFGSNRERNNRTLIEVARTMLADSLLAVTFWAKAVNTACYVINKALVTKTYNKTPYELLNGRSPRLDFMRPFGCPVTILKTLDPLGKFEGKEVSNQHYIVLPLWSSISSTYKSLDDKPADDKPKDDIGSKTVEEPVNKEDQAYRDELDRLMSQEKEASDAADALRKEFEQGYMDQRGEDQAYRDELDRLISQEKEASDAADALRKEFEQGYMDQRGDLFSLCIIHGIIVYQMDVNSAFLYDTIEEEVYVCQPFGFIDPQFCNKVYKLEKALYGLHQAPRAWFQVTPKLSHLQAVKRIFRYLKGQPKLGLWNPRDSLFDLEAYSDSDYAGANLDRKSTIRDYVAAAHNYGHVNSVKQIHAIINGKAVVISESSMRSGLLFNDEDDHRADEAVYQERGDSMERHITTDASLVVRDPCAKKPHWGGVDAQTRFDTTSKRSSNPPLSTCHTFRSGEDRMEQETDLTDFVPPTPHDSPLSGGHTPRSDKGRPNLLKLKNICTTLSNRVLSLEEAKTTQDKVITRLKLRVKRLEKKRKTRTSQPMKRKLLKGRVTTSTDKSLGENASKQEGNDDQTEELNLTDGVDTKVIVEDKDNGEKGGSTAETVSTTRPEVSTAEPITPPTTKTLFDNEDVTVVIPWDQGLAQIESDANLPQRIYKEELAELDRAQKERQKQEEATIGALTKKFDEIQARMDADYELAILGNVDMEDKHVYKIIRANGNTSYHKSLSSMLRKFNRQDLLDLHRLVMKRFEDNTPEGYNLLLWEISTIHTLLIDGTLNCFNMLVEKSVLSLEQTKTNQVAEIEKLKNRVKKLEGKNKKKTDGLKRLYKVGLSSRVESSEDEEDLNQGRIKDQDLFGVYNLDGDDVFMDVTTGEDVEKDAIVAKSFEGIAVATTPQISKDELTLAQTLMEIKAAKHKAKGVTIQEPSEFRTTSPPQPSQPLHAKDKSKGIMVEPEKPLKKKDQITHDEEVARKLEVEMKAEIDEEERIAREKNEANRAITEE
nr:retrovirus-related Pol polyprotein from transposon TNT 1-94 [Tanacetum cinerariifolium]